MARKKQQAYGNESITTLKGAERVRKRPSVIFGSDGRSFPTPSTRRARVTAKRSP